MDGKAEQLNYMPTDEIVGILDCMKKQIYRVQQNSIEVHQKNLL